MSKVEAMTADSHLNPKALALLADIRGDHEKLPPMWAMLGVTAVEFEPRHIALQACADERHINAFGGVHGGYAAALLDTALGLTIFISIDESSRHTTVDLSVKIVKAIPTHVPLTVKTELVHVSRRIGVSQGVLTGQDGTVFAHGTTTCHIKPGR
jgi:uncharacterized protein (TIGR00369 family)